MGAVNVTVRVDEDLKHEFDNFCNNVGINITTAFNMFMRSVIRTREIPFSLTDKPYEPKREYKSIQELFSDFKGEYEPINIDWGKPVGNEIW